MKILITSGKHKGRSGRAWFCGIGYKVNVEMTIPEIWQTFGPRLGQSLFGVGYQIDYCMSLINKEYDFKPRTVVWAWFWQVSVLEK